jgi:hypothetical protein
MAGAENIWHARHRKPSAIILVPPQSGAWMPRIGGAFAVKSFDLIVIGSGPAREKGAAQVSVLLIRRILRKFQIRQPNTLHDHLIGANRRWRIKSRRSSCGHIIILINSIAADAESPDEDSIAIQRH